jgi:hypothetical protein
MRIKIYLPVIISLIIIVIIDIFSKLNGVNFQKRIWIILIISGIPGFFLTYIENGIKDIDKVHYWVLWIANTGFMFIISGILIWIVSWIPGL